MIFQQINICFLIHDKGFFLKRGMEFCTIDSSSWDKYMESINFLPHAPGGINSLGEYESGKQYQKIFNENKTYTLLITISPGVVQDKEAKGRYPPCYYPFFTYNNETRFNSFLQNYRPDDLKTILHPDSLVSYNEMIRKNLWQYECVFGINYDFLTT